MQAFIVGTAVIFLAELGDKSQLLALSFATRFKAWHVLLGITGATLLVHLGSVALGASVGSVLPTDLMSVLAGVAFLGFALWTLRGDSLDEQDQPYAPRLPWLAVLTVGGAFFLAELGDKTMLATVALATRADWLGTWLGSTLGMVAADALAIAAGSLLAKKLSARLTAYLAAGAFTVFGVLLIVQGAR